MAFTVSSLTAYVNEQSKDLLVALQFESETAQYANIQTGVKSSSALQLLANTPVFQDGDSDCAFNASGDTAFTQRTIVTKGVKVQDTLCPRTLQAKWTQLLLRRGQAYTEADIPRVIMEDIVNQIKAFQESCDWQGNTASGGRYNKYDGIATIIKAATGTQTATASTYNATNARTIVKNIISKIPAAQKGNPATKIFMGYDAAETYRQALMDANLYHVPVGSQSQKGIMAEGSVHEIIPVHGLDGLTGNTGDNPFIFALDPSRNLFLGVDMENEEEQFDMWESKDDQNIKYSIRFRRGWQIAYPSEIVEYSNS